MLSQIRSLISSSTTPVGDANANGGDESADIDPDLSLLHSLITAHPDFPLKGILFRDIFPIFRNPKATEILFTRLSFHLQSTYKRIDGIVGIDSRGFLIGPAVALRLNCAFIPIRKKGKLPGATLQCKYSKEYGSDGIEIAKSSISAGSNVVIMDDLLATGGTLEAAVSLVRAAGASVLECLVVIELGELNGRAKLDCNVYSLLQYC